MRLVVFSCLFAMLVCEGLGLGYHQDVGIPEAARIRQREARQVSSRIIGGMPSQYGDNPYLAGLIITLTSGQMSVCSGTLLSERKVLTAGQCWFDGYSQGRSIEVVLGSLQLFQGSRYSVSGISVHPGFNPRQPSNDLAMLTLRWPVSFGTNVKPAMLPPPEMNSTFEGESAKVSGFGKISDWSSVGPDTVQSAVYVPVSGPSWYDCWYNLPKRPSVYNSLICTSGADGWGACGGDLGGPLVVEDYYYNVTSTTYNGSALLIGVTSIQSPFGCQTGFATGYSRVTYFLDWIPKQHISGNCIYKQAILRSTDLM